jgi:hypothetical protein
MSLGPKWSLFLLLLTVPALSSIARADEVPVCGDAFEQAQSRRDEGKLLEARRLLRICSRPPCSATQQSLCSDMLTDVEARVPSVVPEAKDASGADVVEVKVLIDGVLVTTSINGRAIDVDPGLHTFVFELPDGTKAETRVLAGERGKGKVVAVTLGQGPGAPPPPPPMGYPPPPPPAAAPPPPRPSDAPPANAGFQASIRTGLQFPFGNATGASADTMGNTFSWQLPLIADAGWKPSPNWYLALYAGFGFGAPGGAVAQSCTSNSESCFAATVRIGLQAIYYFTPAGSNDPWLGYGIGYEQSSVNIGKGDASGSVSASGWEFGHLMAGIDFRLSPLIGIGPMIDLSVGQYSKLTDSSGSISGGVYTETGSASSSIAQTALHEWLLLGGRIVFGP